MRIRIEHKGDVLIPMSKIAAWVQDWLDWANSSRTSEGMEWTKRQTGAVVSTLEGLLDNSSDDILNA